MIVNVSDTGEMNGNAKMQISDVLSIREMYDEGMLITDIHKLYSHISYSQITRICKRETWKNL